MDVANTSTSDTSQDVGSSPSWAVLDARIMSWLLGSVELHIVTNLRPHSSAQSMWAYLKTVYHQDNDARRFQLEHAIAMFQHGSLSIQDYYSAFLTLWNEYADLVTADVPVAALSTIQTLHATSRRDQFLMKLRPEYESVRSSLLNRSPVPSLDICFGELLREEQRLSTQALLEQSHGNSGTATVAYAAQGRGPPLNSKNLQCFCCKEYGHIAANCPKKFCSYCKKKGHIITACRLRPQHRQAQAFQTSVIIPPVATSAAHGSPSDASSVPAPPATNYCTPEMVQQMLISALSAMGFQGFEYAKLISQKSKGLPLICVSLAKFLDAAASEAAANFSLVLYKAFKIMQNSLINVVEAALMGFFLPDTEDDTDDKEVVGASSWSVRKCFKLNNLIFLLLYHKKKSA
ncbi:hypothetical protein F0562_005797 [Nyssa sinensis]|uniref:CCHC-type domain-containing protein n=1 Tax=Nyssa sinensis TaxID=561372 RepID=A0A5J5ALG9_9ASTE|nr:hypothetical protein F0562_005797 [Nyssa sinensis]